MQFDVNQLQSETVRRNVALGELKAALAILETRGIAVSPEQKQRIEQCSDLEKASRWVRQSVTLSSADELFDVVPRSSPRSIPPNQWARSVAERGHGRCVKRWTEMRSSPGREHAAADRRLKR
jgi:hypothetical protein